MNASQFGGDLFYLDELRLRYKMLLISESVWPIQMFLW